MFTRLSIAALLLTGATMCPAATPSFATGHQTIRHGGLERNYVVRADLDRSRTRRVPLVLVLHGGGGNAANAENMTGFTTKARREGFIVVYPEGTGPVADKLLTWNAVHCCGHAMQNRVDDVGFIRVLIDTLRETHPIDPRRVYVTGMSNGAMMAHRLGSELADRIAAIAPVVGTVFGDEPVPAQAVPALMINGMMDENVPWQGGPPGGRGARAWDGTPARPALDQGVFWANANGCLPHAERREREHWFQWRYSCPVTGDVQLYLLKDNGHAWPGGRPGSRRGDTPSDSMDATEVIWEFFRAQFQPGLNE